ncbi:MAG TPA: hypothetical protein VK399_07495 [Longimicrobiaceae bacterium]|nr:hypothetical protein [Longimicrobiaceae bacterium]
MAYQAMDLEEYLGSRGVDPAALVDQVHAKIGLLPEDVLMAVGSLVEGLGTTKSDLDLVLITSRPSEQQPPGGELAVVVGSLLADVRVLPASEIADLVERVEEWNRSPWDVTHATRYTTKERLLLHRLIRGRRLAEGAGTGGIPWPRVEVLAKLKLQVARQHARTVQVDMAGHRDVGDWRSLVFAAQDLLGAAVDALTAGYLLTNPYSKWRSRLLEAVPDEGWEEVLGVRPTSLSAGERVWRLHHIPPRPEREAALEHALAISAFARAVFVWAERRLILTSAPAAGARRPWTALEARLDEPRLPYLDFDVDYRLMGDEGFLGRLNEFGALVRLTPAEFALALLFDGTTTLSEANAVFAGEVSEGEQRPAQALVSRLAANSLLSPF